MICLTFTQEPLHTSSPKRITSQRAAIRLRFISDCIASRGESRKTSSSIGISCIQMQEKREYSISGATNCQNCSPDIVGELPKLKYYHSGKGNFFTVTTADDQGQQVEYDIFFAASRSRKKGTVTLFVQSAYVRDAQHRSSRPRLRQIGFLVILFNTLANKPIIIPQ